MAAPPNPRLVGARGGAAYFNAVAFCHAFAACTSSLMRYTSPPQRGLIRDEISADRAQMSVRETAATQHNAPNFHRLIFVSSVDEGSFRPAYKRGNLERYLRFFAKASRVNVAEESFSRSNATPTRAKGFS